MPIDVIVVNFLTEALTRSLVQRYSSTGWPLYVYDNSGELLTNPPDGCILVGSGENVLYTEANNVLFAMGTSPYVLLLNPDVALDPDAVRELRTILRRYPEAWGVAPVLINSDGSEQHYYRRLPTLTTLLLDRFPPARVLFRQSWREYMYEDGEYRATGVIEAPPGACILLRRDAVRRAPLMDPSLKLFFSDTDLCRRLNVHGVCRWAGGVVAAHVKGASLSASRRADRWSVARMYDSDALAYAVVTDMPLWPLKTLVGVRRLIYAVDDGVDNLASGAWLRLRSRGHLGT